MACVGQGAPNANGETARKGLTTSTPCGFAALTGGFALGSLPPRQSSSVSYKGLISLFSLKYSFKYLLILYGWQDCTHFPLLRTSWGFNFPGKWFCRGSINEVLKPVSVKRWKHTAFKKKSGGWTSEWSLRFCSRVPPWGTLRVSGLTWTRRVPKTNIACIIPSNLMTSRQLKQNQNRLKICIAAMF